MAAPPSYLGTISSGAEVLALPLCPPPAPCSQNCALLLNLCMQGARLV
jgi:hypothetical protein